MRRGSASGWSVVLYLALAVWCVAMAAFGHSWQVVVGIIVAAVFAFIAGLGVGFWMDDRLPAKDGEG
jgi:putative Ca2+/H+ antiporter (TMEM165/GDT1 family)